MLSINAGIIQDYFSLNSNFFEKTWVYNRKTIVVEFNFHGNKIAFDLNEEGEFVTIDLIFRKADNIELNGLNCICIAPNKYRFNDRIKLNDVFDFINNNCKKIELLFNELFEYDVSIIIPTYNREEFILDCLNSVANLNLDGIKLEVIVIDDFSNDNTVNIVENFGKKNPIKLFKRTYNSGGASIPRNEGIRLAKGKYIFFLDSDDDIHKDLIKDTWNIAELYNKDIVIIKLESIQGRRSIGSQGVFDLGTVIATDFFDNKIFNNQESIKLINRKFLIDNRIYFDAKYKKWEDLVFVSQMYSLTSKISICAKHSYYYIRDHDGLHLSNSSISTNDAIMVYLDCLKFYMVNSDIKKYSCFINRVINILRRYMKWSVSLENKRKFFNIMSNTIIESFLDLKYIESIYHKDLLFLLSQDFYKFYTLHS